MKRLLTLEYLKNINYKPFRILSIIYFIILGGLLFIGLVDFKLFDKFNINLKTEGIYEFPYIWSFTTYIVGLLKIFLGLIIVFSVCQEFTNRMFKQNTIDGLSRKEFITSKFLTILMFSLLSTILVFLITLFLGYTYSTKTDFSLVTQEMYFIGCYFVKLVGFFTFLLFLSVLFRKSIFVLIGLFVWSIVETILISVEKASYMAGVNPDQAIEKLQHYTGITSFLPLESFGNLLKNPLLRLKTAKMFGITTDFPFPTYSVLASIFWIGIFLIGSFLILKRRDT